MEINLKQLSVRPVEESEAPRYRELMHKHHYLGDLAKIGHTLCYVATYEQEWVALLSFSASALKCSVRDRWVGWDFRHQYGRLKLIANNSRFLILPDWHKPNKCNVVIDFKKLNRRPLVPRAVFHQINYVIELTTIVGAEPKRCKKMPAFFENEWHSEFAL